MLLRVLEKNQELGWERCFAKIKNLKKYNWVVLYIFRYLNSVNFLLLHVPRELQEILSNRVSWVWGFGEFKKKPKKQKQSFGGILLVKIIESFMLHWVWRTTITLITLVFMVAQGRIKRLPFKKVFAKTVLLSPVESMELSSIGIPKSNLIS